MRWMLVILLGVIAGFTGATMLKAPPWEFTALAVGILLFAAGYFLSSVGKVIRHRRQVKQPHPGEPV